MPDKDYADRVWKAVESNSSFNVEIPPGKTREAYREMVLKLPDALGDLLDAKVTDTALFRARAAILKSILLGDFIEKASEGLSDDEVASIGENRAEIAREGRETHEESLAWHERVISSAPPVHFATEDLFLEISGLNDLDAASLAEYRAGTLTIGQLLERRPDIILTRLIDILPSA